MGFGTLINDIVYKISGRSLSSSGLYTVQDYLYDYALGGVPFLSGTSDVRPDTERPVPQRKDQFDNYKDPGEYSLNQWWLRSQTSFVGGAGVIYQDPDTQGTSRNIRFHESIGVDPFSDPDFLQLLRRSVATGAVTSDTVNGDVFVEGYDGGSGNDLWVAKGATMYSYRVQNGALNLRDAQVIPGGTPQITDGVVAIRDARTNVVIDYSFTCVYDTGLSQSSIYRLSEGSPGVLLRAYNTGVTLMAQSIGKARGQIAYSRGEKLYILDPYVAVTTALPGTPNASVPFDQTIVAVTDGPDAIYVAANSGTKGYIYKTTFDTTTGVVNGLTLTAVLPEGEKLNSIAAYVNTYLILTTESGFRVGTFTSGGVQYGPNLLTVDSASSTRQGFGEITFFGSRAYIATLGPAQHSGDYGVMAIDLSTLVTDENAGSTLSPYSTWVYFPGNQQFVTDVTVTTDGRVVHAVGFNTPDTQVYLEHKTELLESGSLTTGRCRFNTVEPKLFKYFSIRTPTPLEGNVAVALIDDVGGTTNYITYGPTLDPGTNDIATPTPTGPRNYESLKFTLFRNPTDLSKGGKLDSWQIKALPGTLKQRLITRQFLCFNSETDKSGQVIQGDTSALDRLTAVRQMCQRGDTVTLQDLVNNISDQVIIDDYQFTMMTTPGPNSENYGGYLTIQMRTVADSVPPISIAGGVDEDA